MNLKPLNDGILVKIDQTRTKSPGGIVLPDQAKEKPSRGEVLAVGPGQRLQDGSRARLDVEIGDRVLFAKFAGTSVLDEKAKQGDEDTKYILLREQEVLAKEIREG